MSENDRQRKIEQRAYEIWESEGQPHGRHEEHWLRASHEHDQPLHVHTGSFEGDGGTIVSAGAIQTASRTRKTKTVAEETGKAEPAPSPRKRAGRASGTAAMEASATKTETESAAGKPARKTTGKPATEVKGGG
ncbi:Protein of unknown function [Faunimonas pinastri]|uniref:DUF2934 domain-containing protein n=1 Tax=Faunimonas pinastri TaxID=1855383 RepID=A0A1H9D8Z6_9HYPH|nr:DUF2934 domain-containing protein [Faunimonas pinastri]SEQ09821.1 Protein of unknown function [Faunimonas pinastri]